MRYKFLALALTLLALLAPTPSYGGLLFTPTKQRSGEEGSVELSTAVWESAAVGTEFEVVVGGEVMSVLTTATRADEDGSKSVWACVLPCNSDADGSLVAIQEGDTGDVILRMTLPGRDVGVSLDVSGKSRTGKVVETTAGNVMCNLPPPPEEFDDEEEVEGDEPVTEGVVPVASAPKYTSRPGATHCVYLDFSGGVVPAGSAWGNGSTYYYEALDTDGDLTTFNADEISRINNCWMRMSEDFAAWDISVTTDADVYASYAQTNRAWIVFASSNTYNPTAGGGVAYVNVYGRSTAKYQPGWVFAKGSMRSGKNMAEAGSHEFGHQLGLSHDGLTSGAPSAEEYYTGHSNWAPIMGTGYSRAVTQWSAGEYDFATRSSQDDVAKITSYLSVIADVVGDTPATAEALPTSGSPISVSGLISTREDVDCFSWTSGPPSSGATTIVVESDAGLASASNLDIGVTVYKDYPEGVLVTSKTDAPVVDETVNLGELEEGRVHTVCVEGTGSTQPTGDPTTGYTDYASIGTYKLVFTGPMGTAIDISPPFGTLTNAREADLTTAVDVSSPTEVDMGVVVNSGAALGVTSSLIVRNGCVKVSGRLSLGATGDVNMPCLELSSTSILVLTMGSNMAVNSTVALGGTLEVVLGPGFTLDAGTSVVLFTYGQETGSQGAFASLSIKESSTRASSSVESGAFTVTCGNGRCALVQTPPSPPPPPPSPGTGSAGALVSGAGSDEGGDSTVGIAVGVTVSLVVVGVVVAGLLFLLWRRRSQTSGSDVERDAKDGSDDEEGSKSSVEKSSNEKSSKSGGGSSTSRLSSMSTSRSGSSSGGSSS